VALALVVTALTGIRGQASQRTKLPVSGLAQFGQLGQQDGGGGGGHALNLAEPVHLAAQGLVPLQ
jgi:hypothetical protein